MGRRERRGRWMDGWMDGRIGELLHSPNRCWQSAPHSPRLWAHPLAPQGEKRDAQLAGVPCPVRWLGEHHGEQDLVAGPASQPSGKPRFLCPALHPHAHGSVSLGRAAGPAPAAHCGSTAFEQLPLGTGTRFCPYMPRLLPGQSRAPAGRENSASPGTKQLCAGLFV